MRILLIGSIPFFLICLCQAALTHQAEGPYEERLPGAELFFIRAYQQAVWRSRNRPVF